MPAPIESRSPAYLAWIVALLALAQTSSFADRTVIIVLQPMIKQEFSLSDFQVGILGGLAFAAVYAVLGIPLARLAERRSRRVIIAVSFFVWSATTVLCGFASSYLMLCLLRFGVGVGEAGATPASHSMIADYVPRSRRGRAMSYLNLGTPVGALLGAVIGGFVAQAYGWRMAFIVVGLPGVLLALLVLATVEEPARQELDAGSRHIKTCADCLRSLASRSFFRQLAAAQVLAAVAGYGISAFAALYLVRAFSFDTAQAGVVLGLTFGIAYAIGLMAGGFMHDQYGFNYLPAAATFAATPVTIAAFVLPTASAAIVMIFISSVLQSFALAPAYAAIHNRIASNMRATAIAVILLMTSIFGSGLGPALVGILSDRIAARSLGYAQYAAACLGGNATLQALPDAKASCLQASTDGLRWAITLAALCFAWSAVHYVIAWRRMHGSDPSTSTRARAVGI